MNTNNLLKEAFKLKKNKDYKKAEFTFEKILKISPYHYEANISLGLLNIENKNYNKAIKYFDKVAKKYPNKIDSYINLGNINIINQNYNKAIKYLLKAYKINPKKIDIINNLSFLYKQIEDNTNSLKFIKIGLNIDSKNYFLLYILGTIYFLQDKINEATQSLINAINLQPNYFYSYINLLNILEKTNQINKLKNYLTKAKKIFKDNPELYLIEASYYNRIKKFDDSNHILIDKELIKKFDNQIEKKIRYYDLLGKNFDKLNSTENAYNNFKQRNLLKSKIENNKKFNKNVILENINKYINFFENNKKQIKNTNAIDGYSDPIFLVGFPRSGTTLLDTILRSHTKITVLEEKPYIANIRDNFFNSHDGFIGSLHKIDMNEIKTFRKKYFESVKKDLTNFKKNNLIIDKLPLNIIEVGFINKFFPNSKFILSSRHPCDVVLSCFITDFKINEGMANFYTLEDTVNLFSKVFSLWECYEKNLNIEYYNIKYEDVIYNFKESITKLLIFLDLNWEEELFNFNKKGILRDIIKTPSYSQVIEPLYTGSINRWKKYPQANYLEKNLNVWINKFKYNI